MFEEIKVTVIPDASDYRRALLWYQRKRLLLITLVSTILLLVLGIFIFQNSGGPQILGIRLELVLAAVISPIVFVGISYLGVKRQADKLVKIAQPTLFMADSDGIRTKSTSSDTDVKWDRFYKVVETRHEFIVFPQDNVFYSIPKRFFDEKSGIDKLRALLREQLGDQAILID